MAPTRGQDTRPLRPHHPASFNWFSSVQTTFPPTPSHFFRKLSKAVSLLLVETLPRLFIAFQNKGSDPISSLCILTPPVFSAHSWAIPLCSVVRSSRSSLPISTEASATCLQTPSVFCSLPGSLFGAPLSVTLMPFPQELLPSSHRPHQAFLLWQVLISCGIYFRTFITTLFMKFYIVTCSFLDFKLLLPGSLLYPGS